MAAPTVYVLHCERWTCTSNLLTSAALARQSAADANAMQDTFLTRLPDPVLQLEHFGNPTLGVNDAFKAVSRWWDRITHPAQVIQSMPQALATMLDPADCGPAFVALPQDVQGWSYEFPLSFFEKKVHRIRRISPDPLEIEEAAALLLTAQRPMIIAGGGVQYSGAVSELTAFAETHNIPVVETIAGRANMIATHPLNIGPIGVTGSDSANAIAAQADVILAVGTRLQDLPQDRGLPLIKRPALSQLTLHALMRSNICPCRLLLMRKPHCHS